ncbi:hypothetical protein WL21_04820 [Burkholderia ubonensis]|uniref:hypothetical protein n=1 Tax=Burkholderia ubonensis TaxID=101571 RepID=UPI00075CC1AA|nr:hypothetical protein [Burkholderia ubonensis]KVO87706.1 hypothetical protein WJ81_15790 [Burkholderia ubonensis]KVZ57323.1 hypothetical protein WL20_23575 [Burkholderia ubonensis]KVZ73020.1 hypothetical protein WL21_04820 [Burkholderia ubonensis]
MKLNWKVALAGVVVVAAGAAGAVMMVAGNPFAGTQPPKAAIAAEPARYVALDKLIVMLRASGGARARYMSVDLVFTAPDDKAERRVREQLPYLRALSYQALSEYGVADVMNMRPADYADILNKAYASAYGAGDTAPFTGVMVARVTVD